MYVERGIPNVTVAGKQPHTSYLRLPYCWCMFRQHVLKDSGKYAYLISSLERGPLRPLRHVHVPYVGSVSPSSVPLCGSVEPSSTVVCIGWFHLDIANRRCLTFAMYLAAHNNCPNGDVVKGQVVLALQDIRRRACVWNFSLEGGKYML